MKNLIKLCGIAMAIVVLALSVNLLERNQRHKPFNSDLTMEINTVNTKVEKNKLIEELNSIVANYNAEIYKEVADKENFNKERNIIWFGYKKPKSSNIIIDNNNIKWLSNEMQGKLIHSSNMQEIPLSGEYSITENIISSLKEWANKNDISITFFKEPNIMKRAYFRLVANPLGNSVIAVYILTLMIFVSYFVAKSKERAIKLLSGVSKSKISKYDISFISKNVMLGFIIGIVLMSLYYLITKKMHNMLLILQLSAFWLMVTGFILIVSSFILSIVVSPKTEHIANREIPLKRFGYLITFLKLVTIVFVVSILANTVLAATITKKMSEEYSLWANTKDTFRISFSSLDELYQENNLKEIKKFIENMQNDKSMSMSLVIDKSIEMKSELDEAEFDNFVIVDKAWLDFVDVGIDAKKANGKLKKYEFNDISPMLKQFILDQMPLLINEEKVKAKNLNFYTLYGKHMGALAPNTGNMDTFMLLKKPLIVVIDNPSTELNLEGFVIPTLSTGNIIFSDKTALERNLNNNLKNYIISVDGISDLALKTAQDFREQFISYIISSAILLYTIIYTGILTSKLWAYKNKKRIYIMVTNGIKFFDVFKEKIVKDILSTTIAIILSGLYNCYFKNNSLSISMAVMITITIIYIISILFLYKFFSKKEFIHAVNRI